VSAFTSLQAAIDAAASCDEPELWVAEGTYAPNPASPVATIDTPLSIYGGFAGDEVMLDDRDFVTHPVTLGAPGWQTRVVVIGQAAVDEVAITRLDGLRIDGSDAGAISIDGDQQISPPITVALHNLEITNNTATEGAGIAVLGIAGVEIVGSTFTDNSASHGAVIHYGDSVLHISSSSIVANQSDDAIIYGVADNQLVQDGHLYLSDALVADNIGMTMLVTNLTADNVQFNDNDALAANDQSAVYSILSTVTLSNCSFVGNQGTSAAAITAEEAFMEITDCDFINNASVGDAGAVAIYSNNYSPGALSLFGGSFVGNTAGSDAGGLRVAGNLDVEIRDVLFVDNVSGGNGGPSMRPIAPIIHRSTSRSPACG
jgi:hypothetical protein